MLKVHSKMFFKSFFIQSLWNFERMQNIGFLFALKSFLSDIYSDEDKKKEAFLRHISFFNTHPYVANMILAVVANMEKEIAESGADEKKISELNMIKNIMPGPLAAIGDLFFWGTLRPLAAFISILMAILFTKVLDARFEPYSFLVPIVFFILYNIVHIPLRYWFMFMGFKLDMQNIMTLSKLELKVLWELARYGGLLVITITLFFYLKIFNFGAMHTVFFGAGLYDIFVYGAVLFFSAFVSGKFSAAFLFYTVVLICIVTAYIGI